MGIDFKKLARFIIILGAVLFAYGGVKFLANLPVEASDFQDQGQRGPSTGVYNWAGAVQQAFGPSIQAHDENLRRSEARSVAVLSMIAGGIIAFIGFGVSASVKKNDEATEAEEATLKYWNDPKAILCPFCSKTLERGTWQTYCTQCYQHLPPE